MHSLPYYQHPPPKWYICYYWWTYIHTSLSPKAHSLHYGSLLVLYILWFKHRYNIIYHVSIVIVSHIIASLPSQASVLCLFIPPSALNPGNHWSFYCLHSLPIPESQTAGSIQYAACSDWLLSLMCIQVSFHVFSCLCSSFLFSTE